MDPKIVSARGAVNIPIDSEESRVTTDAVGRLIRRMAEVNNFNPEDLVNLLFTQTADLQKKNAAAALRAAAPEYSNVPLFCSVEPDIAGAPERMIRVLATWYGNPPGIPVYLDKATALRPDLFEES